MKPLKNCPGCNSKLVNHQYNASWFEQYCHLQCAVNYSQFFDKSFEDKNIYYLKFSTENFLVYVYYDHIPFCTAHIYSLNVLKNNGKASPIIKLPSGEIDIHNIKKLDQRLQTLSLFI